MGEFWTILDEEARLTKSDTSLRNRMLWMGRGAPSGKWRELILNATTPLALADPEKALEIKEALDSLREKGIDPGLLSAEEFLNFVKNDKLPFTYELRSRAAPDQDKEPKNTEELSDSFAADLSLFTIEAAPKEKDILAIPTEKILPMNFDHFLDFSEYEDRVRIIISNRDRQIHRNFSRRQFQKCRR